MFDPEDLSLLFPEEGEELWFAHATKTSKIRGNYHKGQYYHTGFHPQGCYIGHMVDHTRCILNKGHTGPHANSYLVWWPVPGEKIRL